MAPEKRGGTTLLTHQTVPTRTASRPRSRHLRALSWLLLLGSGVQLSPVSSSASLALAASSRNRNSSVSPWSLHMCWLAQSVMEYTSLSKRSSSEEKQSGIPPIVPALFCELQQRATSWCAPSRTCCPPPHFGHPVGTQLRRSTPPSCLKTELGSYVWLDATGRLVALNILDVPPVAEISEVALH